MGGADVAAGGGAGDTGAMEAEGCSGTRMLCYATLCYTMLCYAMLCYAMLCYSILCGGMLCYAMSCYAMLCYSKRGMSVCACVRMLVGGVSCPVVRPAA